METPIRLEQWMVIRISGNDKTNFLNGLIPTDINKVPLGQFIKSCWLSPQGKIKSIFWMGYFKNDQLLSDDGFIFLVPPEMKRELVEDLVRFNLNLQVKLEDISSEIPPLYFSASDVTDCYYRMSGFPFFPDGFFVFVSEIPESIPYSESLPYLVKKDYIPPYALKGLNPFEVGLRDCIDLEKGCFLGQEPLARMTYRGRPRYMTYLCSLDMQNFEKYTKDDKIVSESHEIGRIVFKMKLGDEVFFICQLRSRDLPETIFSQALKTLNARIVGKYS